jgi:hypothetical protein
MMFKNLKGHLRGIEITDEDVEKKKGTSPFSFSMKKQRREDE